MSTPPTLLMGYGTLHLLPYFFNWHSFWSKTERLEIIGAGFYRLGLPHLTQMKQEATWRRRLTPTGKIATQAVNSLQKCSRGHLCPPQNLTTAPYSRTLHWRQLKALTPTGEHYKLASSILHLPNESWLSSGLTYHMTQKVISETFFPANQ